jgi:hypothetical protein
MKYNPLPLFAQHSQLDGLSRGGRLDPPDHQCENEAMRPTPPAAL